MTTNAQRHNMLELIALLRTFPEASELKTGELLGHWLALALMVLVQRRQVIEALQEYDDSRHCRDS